MDHTIITHLIATTSKFALYKGDITISLVSLELIYKISRHLSQENIQEFPEDILTQTLICIIGKIREIGCDERAEIRHNAYRTLEEILVDHGTNIYLKVWKYAFFEGLEQLLQFVELHFFACRTKKGQVVAAPTPTNVATPKFSIGQNVTPPHHQSVGRVMKFDEETIKKASDESKVKENQWEESVTLLFATFSRVFKKFVELTSNNEYLLLVLLYFRKERQDIKEKVWALLLEGCIRLIKLGTYTIINSVFKSLQQIAEPGRDCICKRFEDTWKIFDEFMLWMGNDKKGGQCILRPIGTKLAPTIIEALRAIFKLENSEAKALILNVSTFKNLCKLLKKV